MLERMTAATLGSAFAATARLRSGRPVHREGVAFAGTLALEAGEGLALLPGWGAPREAAAVVRLSRSFSIPRPGPDVLGVSVKLPDLHGPGGTQDLLVVSCPPSAAGALVAVPTRRYDWRTYSSLLPYVAGPDGRRLLLGARSLLGPAATEGLTELDGARAALAAGTLAFELLVAPVREGWRRLGTIALREELPAAEEEVLRYDPWRTGGGLEPVGVLNRLRRPSYESAQAARPQLGERRGV